MTAFLGAPAQLREQAGLSDPGLALDDDAGRVSSAQAVEGHVELQELGSPTDDRIGPGGHASSRA